MVSILKTKFICGPQSKVPIRRFCVLLFRKKIHLSGANLDFFLKNPLLRVGGQPGNWGSATTLDAEGGAFLFY